MKTKVELTGEGLQLRCDSLDEDFPYEFPLILSDVKLVRHIEGNELEDITKQKGKYVKGKFIREEIKDELGDEMLIDTLDYSQHVFEFEIEHEGEFNPKLIQLLKSDYEFQEIPYAILANKILYDGKEIPSTTFEEFVITCPEYRQVNWDGFYYSSSSID